METYPLSVEMLSYKNVSLRHDTNQNVQFQKISILHPQKGLEFPGGGGSERPKTLKKCMKLNWNFQGGRWGLKIIPSMEEAWIFFGTI